MTWRSREGQAMSIRSYHPGTMIEPYECETECPTCGCCEHTPVDVPCRCGDCLCESA